MSVRYRVMVTNKDNKTFCVAKGVPESDLDKKLDEAEQKYPKAQDIWMEKES